MAKQMYMSLVSAMHCAVVSDVSRRRCSAPRMELRAWRSLMNVCLCLTVNSFCFPVVRMDGRFLLLYLTLTCAL